ncbi:MAG: efflux RND transporter periplasmic adaptor subunit [Alphaproteobacteria bacterium]|nr:MAG: efflux RND transporter periplasmic adaptor subunit [Alphaproteobacteria bacterium]
MIKNKPVLLLALTGLLLSGGLYWSSRDKEADASVQKEAEAAPADSTQIAKDVAEAAGVRTETVGSATVRETITLTGRITLNQNTTAQVKARFPGIVREVKKGQGESVQMGDVLALVESNDSLQVYPVKAPIGGVILARNTNIGDVAGEQPLFTIANVSDVWAEFHIFPRDIDQIKRGQMVHVTSFEGEHTGKAQIATMSPIAEASSQTIVARVTLPNPDGLWHSGMTVRGDVEVNAKEVLVAVKTSAIQRMENNTAVFAQMGDRYVMRPIKTGISDNQWTEILDGLQSGESYVTENSFLIKADIGKAGAKEED